MLIEYDLLTDLDEIEALSPEWEELLSRSRCNRAFSSVTWYLAACRAQPHLLPCVAVARRDHALAALLPLALKPTGDAAFPSELSSYNDLIAASEDDGALAGLLDFAVSPPKPYLRLDLRWVRKSSNLLRATRMINDQLDSMNCFQLDKEYYSFIRLPGSYEEYLESRSRLFRRNIRRARRIAEADGFRIERLEPASFPAERIPELFLAFHLARFGDESTFRKRPEHLAFAQMALPELFTRRQIMALALYRESEILGLDICLVGYNSLCAWNGGYPPEIERWSPGRMFVDEGIQIAFRWGLQEYDLLRGPQQWKRSWTNELRDVGRMEIVVGSWPHSTHRDLSRTPQTSKHFSTLK